MDNNDEIFPPIPKLELQNRFMVIDNCYYEETRVSYEINDGGQVRQIDIRDWVQKPFPDWYKNNFTKQ